MDPYGVGIPLTDNFSLYGKTTEIPSSYTNGLDILSVPKSDPYTTSYMSIGLTQNTEDIFASKYTGLTSSDWAALPTSPARVTHNQYEVYKTSDFTVGNEPYVSKEAPVSFESVTSAENYTSYVPTHDNYQPKNVTSIVGSDLKIEMHIPASISLHSEYRPEVDSLKAFDEILKKAGVTHNDQTLGLGKTLDFSSDSYDANRPKGTLDSITYPKNVESVSGLGDTYIPNVHSNFNLDLHGQVPLSFQPELRIDATNYFSNHAIDGSPMRDYGGFTSVGVTPTGHSLGGFGKATEMSFEKIAGSDNMLNDIMGPKVGSNLNLDYQSGHQTDINHLISVSSPYDVSSVKTAVEILKYDALNLADQGFLNLETSSNLSFEHKDPRITEDYGMILSPTNISSVNGARNPTQSSHVDKYGFSKEDLYGLKTSLTLFDAVINPKVSSTKAIDNVLNSDISKVNLEKIKDAYSLEGKNTRSENLDLHSILNKPVEETYYAYSPVAGNSRSHSLNYLAGFGDSLSPISRVPETRIGNDTGPTEKFSFNFFDSYKDKPSSSMTDQILQQKAIGSVTEVQVKDINTLLNENFPVPVNDLALTEEAIISRIDARLKEPTHSGIHNILNEHTTTNYEAKPELTVDQILSSNVTPTVFPEKPIHSAIDLILKEAAAKPSLDEILYGKSARSAIDLNFNNNVSNAQPAFGSVQNTLTVEQLLNQKPLAGQIVNDKIINPLAGLLASRNASSLANSKAGSLVDEFMFGKAFTNQNTALPVQITADNTLIPEQGANALSKDNDINGRIATILSEKKTGSVIDIIVSDKGKNLSVNSLEGLNVNQLIGTGSLNTLKIPQIIDSLLDQKNKSAPNEDKTPKSSHKSSDSGADMVINKTPKNQIEAQSPVNKVEVNPFDAILNTRIINPIVGLLTQDNKHRKTNSASLASPSITSTLPAEISIDKLLATVALGKILPAFKPLPGPLKNQFVTYNNTTETHNGEFNALTKKHLKEDKKEKFGQPFPLLSVVARYKTIVEKKKK